MRKSTCTTGERSDNIQKKLIQMVRFIEQEGYEKAEEIDAATEEEFHIEKGNLVQEERLKINKEYERMEKASGRVHRTQLSAMAQKSRITLLERKREHIQEIQDIVTKRVQNEMLSPKRTINTLQLLILEGLYKVLIKKLMEENVTIQCRQADVHSIQSLLPCLEITYKQNMKRNTTLRIDGKHLSEDILPGVTLLAKNGKIKLHNSLNYRIEQIVKNCSPIMNTIFYGTSKMRTGK